MTDSQKQWLMAVFFVAIWFGITFDWLRLAPNFWRLWLAAS